MLDGFLFVEVSKEPFKDCYNMPLFLQRWQGYYVISYSLLGKFFLLG